MSDKPTCAVRGAIRPGAMCSRILVGGELCGFAGECVHKIEPAEPMCQCGDRPARQEPLTESQVDDLIHSKHFDRSYKLHASDETCVRWYRLGLRDGERAHGIVAAPAEGGAAALTQPEGGA